jgi:hypothetical protein
MLSLHDHVWLPKCAAHEAAYFDRQILKHPFSWYQDMFDDPQGKTTMPGEKTPTYSCLKPQSIAFLKRRLPDVKLMLLLRRPDERAWSQARMEVSKGRYYNERPLDAASTTRCIFHLGTLRNSRLTRYDRIIANWRRSFPPQQMLLLFQDDVEQRPREVLNRVTAFLGIPDCPAWTADKIEGKVWVSPSLEMPPAAAWYLRRRYQKMIKSLPPDLRAAAAAWFKSPASDLKVSLWAKIKVRLIADVATIPFNLGYRCYDAIRDVRMFFRIRSLERADRAAAAGKRQEALVVTEDQTRQSGASPSHAA